MCTLMMLKGWKLAFSPISHNYTYCPENFKEFLKQRRRWYLSDVFNQYLLISNLSKLIYRNKAFSLPFSLYLFIVFLLTLLAPFIGMWIMVGGLVMISGVSHIYLVTVNIVILVIYTIMCVTCTDKILITVTKFLYGVIAIIMTAIICKVAVLIGQLIFTGEQLILILSYYVCVPFL